MGFKEDWKKGTRGLSFSDWIGSFFGMESRGYTHEDGSIDKFDYKNNQYIHIDPNGRETREDQKGSKFPWWAYAILVLISILGVLYVFRRKS